MFKFTLFWLDGKKEHIESDVNDIGVALSNVGYGYGALSALDYYSCGHDTDTVFNSSNGKWENKNV